MRFTLMIEAQQGLTYAEQLELARLAERVGFEAFFRSDHYRSFPGRLIGRPPTRGRSWPASPARRRPSASERWCAVTSAIRVVRQGRDDRRRDERGRSRWASGRGWNEPEHSSSACPSPIRERADLMEDELAILHGLWEEPDGWSFDGQTGPSRSGLVQPEARPAAAPPIIVAAKEPAIPAIGPLATPTSTTCRAPIRTSAPMPSGGWTRVPEDRPRSCRHPPFGDGRAASSRDAAEMERRVRDQLAMVGDAGTDRGGLAGGAAPRWILGTPDQARAMAARFAATGVERDHCSRISCHATTQLISWPRANSSVGCDDAARSQILSARAGP